MADQQNTPKQPSTNNSTPGSEDAAQLIRGRIDELHTKHQNDAQSRSPHQMSLIEKFWAEHHAHPDKEAAWNHYYQSLSDHQKHQLWQETQPQQQPSSPSQHANAENKPKKSDHNEETDQNGMTHKAKRFKEKHKAKLAPFFTAIMVVIFVLALNYNEVVVAQVKQYVTPGTGQNSPTIIDPNSEIAIGDEPRLIIPKINVDVPVVYDIKTYDEADIQLGLERGVVHYGKTAVPGEAGNNVIVGHSSNNFFNGGKYKFAFVLLDRLEVNDTFILHYKGERYIYRVYNKVVVAPDDFSIIQPTPKPSTTLVTCTPPGTSWRRLAVQAEQISPSPTQEQTSEKPDNIDTGGSDVVPGNSQSLFDRLLDSVF